LTYRPTGRRYRPPVTPSRLSPSLRRASLARINGGRRHRNGGGSGVLILSTLLLVLLAVVIAGGGLLGGAGVATKQALEADLPDPSQLEQLDFPQPTIIYDRTGKIELGRFQQEERRVVAFEDIPTLILDATTAAEDRTFWQNEGFDPAAIGSAIFENVSGEGVRGASTITQQLVRARLLPPEYLKPGADRYLRKAKEVLQAARVTQAFPGEAGKRRIITAYLNQIYYGHKAYGIAAAAKVYFGVTNLSRLTASQAALLAGLPKSPSTLDPYRYARPDRNGRLVVPRSAPPVVRRDYVLRGMQSGRWTRMSGAALNRALREPVVLAGEKPLVLRAPHFTWQVKRELDGLVADRAPVETGGYRVITSLDYRAQQLAERYITAAAVLPNLPRKSMDAQIKRLRLQGDAEWITRLRATDLHNGAMVVLDYRTGDVLAYVGSAGYYRKDESRKFDPKYDVAGIGYRQPGSAWKPVLYAAGFEERRLTPGTLLLDITTRFGKDWRTGRGWTPKDADRRERGPVLLRKALQYSLNIPAIRGIARVGNERVAAHSEKLGIRFMGGRDTFIRSGLAGGIGTVEVRVIDLTSAFGTFGNGGVRAAPRSILKVTDSEGVTVYKPEPALSQAISPQSACLITDILKGNTNPSENLLWGPLFRLMNGPRGERRPAAVKTGTTNDIRDLSTYGYLAPPHDPKAPAIAVGVWMGNSDHSQPRGSEEIFASQGPGRVWMAFMRDYTRRQSLADFRRPSEGLVRATIDKWSGGRPGPWTRGVVNEWFMAGTQPGGVNAVDRPGLLYSVTCGGWRVNPLEAEQGWPRQWQQSVANWMARARMGPRVSGSDGTATAYLWGESSWGGPIAGPCAPPAPPRVTPRFRPQPPARGPAATPPPANAGARPTPAPAPPSAPATAPAPTPKPTKPPKPTPPPPGGGGAPGPTPTPQP
jgi:membrane peptidoglycan carboxypeptidase